MHKWDKLEKVNILSQVPDISNFSVNRFFNSPFFSVNRLCTENIRWIDSIFIHFLDEDQNRPYGIDPGLFGPSGISLLALMQQQQSLQQLQQQQQAAVPSMTSSMTSPSMSNSMTHHDDSEPEMKIDEIESEVDEAPMVISEAAPIESQEVH